jgi:hypothetical protein
MKRAMPSGGSGNIVAAEALFDDGRKLVEQGRFAEAARKFLASFNMDPAMGTLLNLAMVEERLGDKRTARDDYETVCAVSTRDGRSDRAALARARMQALDASTP